MDGEGDLVTSLAKQEKVFWWINPIGNTWMSSSSFLLGRVEEEKLSLQTILLGMTVHWDNSKVLPGFAISPVLQETMVCIRLEEGELRLSLTMGVMKILFRSKCELPLLERLWVMLLYAGKGCGKHILLYSCKVWYFCYLFLHYLDLSGVIWP